ncbi:MAG: YtxH domain-containing protein [Candidatus Azobacteroides sp.]|nr:YtxH domain-containing protein [Candidatus Azobacteroides sp.]
MKTANCLLAFLGGAVAGAAIALLYAPEKGTETRKKISDKVKEGAEYTGDTINDLIEKIQTKAKEGFHKSADATQA